MQLAFLLQLCMFYVNICDPIKNCAFRIIMKEYENKPIVEDVLNIYNEISTLLKCKLIHVSEWRN